MTRRLLSISALASILLAGLPASPALALDEADRLWLLGDRAFADGLYPVARRVLDRFVVEHPNDTRVAPAMLLLGRARLPPARAPQELARGPRSASPRKRSTLSVASARSRPCRHSNSKGASGKPSRSIA